MAATEKKQMWYWKGTIPPIRKQLMAASQGIFMPGTGGYVSTSGTVKITDTSDGTGDVWHGFIIGVVDKTTAWPITAAFAVNAEVRMSMISKGTVYAGFAETSGTDTAATQAMVGDSYGITVSSTAGEIGYASIDVGNANTTVLVDNIASNEEAAKFTTSDSPGVLLVHFLPANIDASKA